MSGKNESLSISEVIAACSGLSFLLSIFYEKGFFKALGVDFFYLLSVTDFFSSAISWLPSLVIVGVFGFSTNIILNRVEGWRSEEQLIKESANPKFTAKFRGSTDGLMAGILFVSIMAP